MLIMLLLLTPYSGIQFQTLHAQEIEFINDDDEERIDETDTPINIPKRYLLNGMAQIEADSMIWFQTPDVYIYKEMVLTKKMTKTFYSNAYAIKKVYNLSKEIEADIKKFTAHLDSLPSKKEKEQYKNLVEKELTKKYRPRLSKLTARQGRMLIKLTYRQNNVSAYKLIKVFYGSVKAFTWNAVASLFKNSLKKEYDPVSDEEDKLIERAIHLIESGQL